MQPFDRSHLDTVYIAAFEKGVRFVEALGVYPICFLSHNSDYYSLSFTSSTVPHFGQVIVFDGWGANSSGTDTSSAAAILRNVVMVVFPFIAFDNPTLEMPIFRLNPFALSPYF